MVVKDNFQNFIFCYYIYVFLVYIMMNRDENSIKVLYLQTNRSDVELFHVAMNQPL